MSWYWNEIRDRDSARYATTTAVWISYLIASAHALLAILSVAYHKPILGLDGWALVDAGIFAVVGWQVARLSRAWAIVGLLLYLSEALISIGTCELGVAMVAPGIIAFVFIAVYLNALRGTFAYHKYVKLQSSQPSQSMQAG